jgi:hypothetical protein
VTAQTPAVRVRFPFPGQRPQPPGARSPAGHAALAGVLDALAASALRRGQDDDAELAARLLGAAHSVRGAFNESSLDAPAARAAARRALGEPAFGAAYQRGRELGYATALSFAGEILAAN